MFLYSLGRTKTELLRIDEQPCSLSFKDVLSSKESVRNAQEAFRIVRASSKFFVDRKDAAKSGRTSPHRAPTVYRDTSTQLIRCFYREIVVRFRTRVRASRRDTHLADLGLEIVRRDNSPHQLIVRDPHDRHQGDDLIRLANTIAEREEDVVYAAPNFISEFRRTAPPVIPTTQWHLDNSAQFFGQVAGQDIRARQAWQIDRGNPKVVVAVLDDGVDLSHPALQGQIYLNPSAPDQAGRDFFDPLDSGFYDPRPKIFTSPFNDSEHNDIHGTPCAGLIAALAPDGRAYGVAPNCKVLPIKIFHGGALASENNVANAIRYAAGIADILSCSWHCSESVLIEHAIATAASTGRQRKGCAVFCSVGDNSGGTVRFPASLKGAIAVGASTDDGQPALYSNAGPKVAMVAPSDGGSQGIFTCDVSFSGMGYNAGDDDHGGADGFYTNRFGGTSAAVPIAAGAAAVLLSHQPSLTATQLTNVLQQTADKIVADVDADGHSDQVGFGKINLFAALNSL